MKKKAARRLKMNKKKKNNQGGDIITHTVITEVSESQEVDNSGGNYPKINI